MAIEKITQTESETWQQVEADLKTAAVPLNYQVEFLHNQQKLTMIIDMDPGGGFEGGMEYTSFTAPVPIQFTSLKATITGKDEFRFALHDEDVMDRVGKFFGSEDIVIGFPEFDKQLIVKTNNAEKVKMVFSSPAVRKVFQSIKNFTLQIRNDADNENVYALELMIDRAIMDHGELKQIYVAFTDVLDKLAANTN